MSQSNKVVVLCVDDNPCVLAALRRLFRAEPFAVVTATNAAQALAILRHYTVRVVISDLRMPDISGSELLAEVEQRWPWIGRIILTAYPEAQTRGIEAGIDLLIHSPWDDEALRISVRRLVRDSDPERPLELIEKDFGDGSPLVREEGRLVGRLSERQVVVCVDDEPGVLSALRRSLRREPYVVLTTSRPEEALEWVRSRDVCALVTDERMPGMTGTELAARVLAHSPSTARILLTEYAVLTAHEPPLRKSVECLIAKPWDDAMLRRALRAFLVERAILKTG